MSNPLDAEVVLVNSNRWKPGIAPLALDHLAAALEAKGISHAMLDLCLTRSPAGAIRRFFEHRKPRLIGVTFRNLDDVFYGLLQLDDLKRSLDLIRAAAPGVPIVIGGSGFSIAPEAILDYCGLDLGVWGEGEIALPMLVENLGNESAYATIPGLVYRTAEGIVKNPQSAMPMDAFTLAGSSRPGLKLYYNGGDVIGSVGIQTRRGCTGKCVYCVTPQVEGVCRRLRPPEIIADEIEEALSMGWKNVFLADSEFNEPEHHAIAICEEFLRRGLESRMNWTAYTSCVEFTPTLAKLMKRAGCTLAISSLDSADDKLLEGLGKLHRQADIVSAMEAAQEADLTVAYGLMIGGPGETLETLNQTVSFLNKRKGQRVAVKEPPGIRVYPNTPMADIVAEEAFSRKNANLFGSIEGNDNLVKPVYYLSAGLTGYRGMAINWRRLASLYYKLYPMTSAGVWRRKLPRIGESN